MSYRIISSNKVEILIDMVDIRGKLTWQLPNVVKPNNPRDYHKEESRDLMTLLLLKLLSVILRNFKIRIFQTKIEFTCTLLRA
jgi:hypothetical protein